MSSYKETAPPLNRVSLYRPCILCSFLQKGDCWHLHSADNPPAARPPPNPPISLLPLCDDEFRTRTEKARCRNFVSTHTATAAATSTELLERCDAYFGANASRPYPGADALLHVCSMINSMSIEEALSLHEIGKTGRVNGKP